MATSLRLSTRLWPHQKAAIRTFHGYLGEARRGGSAALITMPTGTGKSGVIAWALTRLPELTGHRLLLTPWVALSRQLMEDIDWRFWTRLADGDRPKKMPPVRLLPPSSEIESLREIEDSTVFVATISAISTLSRDCERSGEDIAAKFAAFDCVVVDEGHYEPAEKWSGAIRSLQLPTILLTATPYRNDLKFFEIGDWRYRFPHHVAEAERFLRKPEFRSIGTADPNDFVAELKALVEAEFEGDDSVRVIVRCKDAPTIQKMVLALERIGESAIGIHERFDESGSFTQAVPSRDEMAGVRYWVHQYKLVEGIDDPNFKVVALFDSLRNGRAVVQQIGRVLRNPARAEADMKALVVARGDRDLQAVWRGYTEFDQDELAESVATVSDLVENLLDSQPRSFYFGGAYRVRIDLTSPTAWQTFAFPLRARIFRATDAAGVLDMDVIAARTAEEWEEIDRSVFTTQRPDTKTAIVPYVTAENSSLLRSATFVEPQFGYTMLRLSGDLLFIYDARGRVPQVVLQSFEPLPAADLSRLFPEGSSALTSVSLLNTDIGKQAARSRQVRAAAIDALAPDLADYGYVCTIAEGYTGDADDRARRYVGLSRARLTDYRTTERDFAAYAAWLDEVEQVVRSGQPPVGTFNRYAVYAPVPSDPTPIHVLLDVFPPDFAREEEGKSMPLALEDTAYEVEDGSFEIVVGGRVYPAALTWSGRGYELKSTLSLNHYVETVPGGRELIHAINEDQLLRVVPVDRGVIYSRGQFFAPRGLRAAAGLLSLLTPIDRLATISSEKGTSSQGDDWDEASIFGLVSALAPTGDRVAEEALARLLGSPDLLICTDRGTEVADFIGLKGDRVVLIHAKASSSPRPASASALHDVVSQAVKNLPYLQPFEETKPLTTYWTNPWKAADDGSITRCRAGSYATGSDAWKQIRAVIANPQADREVWLVMGQSLSVQRLKDELSKKKPAPQVMQIFSLLQTAWSATSQIGARLRVFCSP